MKAAFVLIWCLHLLSNPQEEWKLALERANAIRSTDPDSARSGFQAAERLARQAGGQQLALVWAAMAEFLIEQDRHQDAEAVLENARSLFHNHPEISAVTRADILRSLAVVKQVQGRRDESAAVLREEIQILEGAADVSPNRLLPALNMLTYFYLEAGRMDDTRLLISRITKIAKGYESDIYVLQAWVVLSEVERIAGNYDAARRSARKALRDAEPLKVMAASLYEAAHNQLGRIAYESGDLNSADFHWKAALQSINTRPSGFDADVYSLRTYLARVALSQGRSADAERDLVALTKLAEADGHQVEFARGLYVLGTVYLQQKQLDKAQDAFIRSLSIADVQLGAMSLDSGICLFDLARLHLKRGQPAEAAKFSGRAAKISADDHSIPMVWVDLMRIHSEVMRKLRRKDEAKDIDQRAGKIMAARNVKTHTVDVMDLRRK